MMVKCYQPSIKNKIIKICWNHINAEENIKLFFELFRKIWKVIYLNITQHDSSEIHPNVFLTENTYTKDLHEKVHGNFIQRDVMQSPPPKKSKPQKPSFLTQWGKSFKDGKMMPVTGIERKKLTEPEFVCLTQYTNSFDKITSNSRWMLSN